MERNTLLAIVLSVLVLYTYQVVFAPPKQSGTTKTTQNIAAQDFTKNITAQAPALPNSIPPTTKSPAKSVDYKMETPNKGFSFTNVGGALHNIEFSGGNLFPIVDVLSLGGFENVSYSGSKANDQTVSLSYVDKNLEISKTYHLGNENLINVRLEIKNLSEISILNNFSFKAFGIDVPRMENMPNNRESALYEYSVYSKNNIFRRGNAFKFNDKNDKSENGEVNWMGFRDHYHAFIIKPEFKTAGYQFKANGDNQLSAYIKLPEQNLAAGATAIYDFKIYAGPQDVSLMKKEDQSFSKIIAFSGFAIIEWIAQAIYNIIPFFHTVFRSWGVAIILISLIIYGMTYPLTMKSMLSMRRMQEVQPKIAALKDRFKNDPQKLNVEMMEIYRREKINPFGGCLPFIIQMPFFMALYQVLWRAQYFQGQGFLWIKDLSQPDRLLILPFYLPFFGNELNILPIATGVMMFFQQRISSKNMVIADEQQAMQQKMMMYILPVMMGCMFYKFSSAWAIYFLIFYILSTVTQFKIAQLKTKPL